MMRSLGKTLFVLLILGLHGCASLSSHDDDISSEEIRAVQQQLQEKPKDIALNRKLIGLYLAKFNDNKSRRLALLLIDQAEEYLLLNPQDEPVKVVLYEFLARDALSRKSEKNLTRLRKLFNDSTLLKQTTYVPPSAIQAYILLDSRLSDENKRLLKKMLHAATKENPNYTKSYRMLSSIYRLEKRFTLAIAILRQSEKVNANDPTLYKEIGDLYLEKAEATSICFIQDQNNLNKALQAYRKVAILKPDAPQSHEDLANLYHWTRKIPLYLHEAKRRYELDQKSIQARRDYAGSLFWRRPDAA